MISKPTAKAVEKGKSIGIGAAGLVSGAYAVHGFLASVILLYSVGVRATAHSMANVVLQQGGGDMSSSLGSALCDIGIGALITAVLFLISMFLIYGALGDLSKWFASSNSKDSGRRSEAGGHLQSAGKKVGGGIVIGASPTILSALGFSLLSCVTAVNPFA